MKNPLNDLTPFELLREARVAQSRRIDEAKAAYEIEVGEANAAAALVLEAFKTAVADADLEVLERDEYPNGEVQIYVAGSHPEFGRVVEFTDGTAQTTINLF